MKRINILEPSVANKIAAGEVVERPASIVKELVENSLDAGATAITVEIRESGIDYIRITDNGAGIDREDVPIAFERHATSKLLSADELECIESFGFRGEALASIAAVSKVTMRTRTADAEYGTKIVVEGGKQVLLEPCASPTGTTIEVNEVFYNVPARLKFIKNQRTETALITDYVSRLMLANPDIAIKFINNARPILQTSGGGDLSSCIFNVYGSSVFASLYSVAYDDGYIMIDGFVGGEDIARSNRIQQSVFINRRYIKSALISNAVQRAFLTRLMNRRFPFFVLNITISSREIDVNVHPNKLSVRFRDEERVSNAVTKAIRDALNGLKASLTHGNDALSDMKKREQEYARSAVAVNDNDIRSSGSGVEQKVRELFRNTSKSDTVLPAEPTEEANHDSFEKPFSFSGPADFKLSDSGVGSVEDFDSFLWKSNSSHAITDESAEPSSSAIPTYVIDKKTPELPKQKSADPEQLRLDTDKCRIIGTAFDTYIIVQQGEAIYYIDQHAAHERIRYEKLISGKLRLNSQILAVPSIIVLDPVSYSCVVSNIERFEEFGYSIDYSNEPSIRIDAVPDLPGVQPDRFFRDALDCILDNPNADEIDLLRSRLIQRSCKGAVKAGEHLDIAELQAIVNAYSAENVPLTCPHGRPVLIRVTKNELQKLFKRIV